MNEITSKRKKIALGAAALLIAIGLVFFTRTKSTEPAFRPVTVTKGSIEIAVRATGMVQPENRVDIKPPINGRVERVLVKEGDRVRKAQVLAWMSSTERAALIDAARAKGSSELKEWEEMYNPTPILAPITGTVIQRNVESGQSFTSQEAVFVMSDRLAVKAQVDETDIAQVKQGQQAKLVLDAYPDHELPGKVARIAFDAKTVSNVTTYDVYILPEEIPPYMRSGMTANVTFHIESKSDILVIPTDTVKETKGKKVVRVQTSAKQNAEREIETGLTDGKLFEVRSGLTEGEVVLAPDLSALQSKKRGGSPLTPGGRRGH